MDTQPLDGSRFSWQGKAGFAFASDLGFGPGRWPTSFLVRSPRTGRTVRFSFLTHRYDAEGETVSAVYLAAGDLELTIGND